MTDTQTTAHIPDETVQAREKIEKIAKSFINEGSRDYTQEVCSAIKNIGLELLDAVSAFPHLSAPCAVEVRKLEWVQDEHGSIEFTAQSMFGEYSVHIERKSAYACSLDGVKYERININHPYTVDQAKAAAQADFESRVLSCVVTKPVDVAAVREAFKLGWQSSETANVEDTWEDTFAYHFTDAHEIRATSDKNDLRTRLPAAPNTEAGK